MLVVVEIEVAQHLKQELVGLLELVGLAVAELEQAKVEPVLATLELLGQRWELELMVVELGQAEPLAKQVEAKAKQPQLAPHRSHFESIPR